MNWKRVSLSVLFTAFFTAFLPMGCGESADKDDTNPGKIPSETESDLTDQLQSSLMEYPDLSTAITKVEYVELLVESTGAMEDYS